VHEANPASQERSPRPVALVLGTAAGLILVIWGVAGSELLDAARRLLP
jgi:hypothetical protein